MADDGPESSDLLIDEILQEAQNDALNVVKVGPRGGDSMDRLHGGNGENVGELMGSIASYSWNVFRYIGDWLHIIGVACVGLTLARNKSCRGVSFRTQVVYLVIFLSRYLDLFMGAHNSNYLKIFKISYILTSIGICGTMFSWRRTIEHHKDTCSLIAIVLPCMILGIITAEVKSIQEILWTFSELLEGFAMVPQYIFTYRDEANTDLGVASFILCIGGYRVCYAMNWMYKRAVLGSRYTDINSWIGGIIEILFFADYLSFRFGFHKSFLREWVLAVDTKINDIQQSIELKVIGGMKRREHAHGDDSDGAQGLRKRRQGGGRGDVLEEAPMLEV